MPYEDEDPHWGEPDAELNELSKRVIGAALEVHRRLGPGLDESLYEEALAVEFTERDIDFQRQVIYLVTYRGRTIGEKRMDFVVDGRLVVELKAISELAAVHSAQVNTYLKISGLTLGLLINFNVALLKDGLRRIVHSGKR